MFKSDKQKFAIYSGSMSAGLIALLFLLNVFDGLELKTLDIRFRMLSEPATASKDIVFAVIDDNSLHAYESHNMPWPWPRSVYGELVNYFQQHGAKAVVFDILFASKDIYSTYFGDEQNDQQFVASMSEAKNVLLAIQLKEETGKLNFPFTFPRKNELPLSIAPKQKYSSGIFPPSEYQNVAQSVGVVNFISDRDNICRRLPLLFNFNDERVIPQLGFATYLMTMQQGDAISKKGKQLMVGKNKIPLDKDGNFILWWYGNGGPNQCFQYYSVHTILQSSIFEKRGEPSLLPQNTFQGKYVIIGSNAPGLLDFRPTPFTKDEKYPGMEIYATMLSNLLQKDFLRKEFSWITILIIMLISYSASFTMFHQTRVYKSVLITVGLASVWIAISCYFFSTQKLWLDIVPPIFALATSFAISSSWSYSSEGKARRQLRKTFNRYLDATVVRQLESNPNEAGLGGKEMEATVYFSDI
ncbi:MAG: CHASE2 domain-containing protein, partial [Ignavibacteriales bacterium]|nr:CHASE2 domain-containing protein [Ignavibacteriales bacterium]